MSPDMRAIIYTLLGIAAILILCFMTSPAFSQTLLTQEICVGRALDMKLAAEDRDSGVTLKMQIEQAAAELENCKRFWPHCAYQTNDDDMEVIQRLTWMYGKGKAATPDEVRQKVLDECQAKLVPGARGPQVNT